MRAKFLAELQRAGNNGIAFDALHKCCEYLNHKSARDALVRLKWKTGYGIVAEDGTVRRN